jgi:hypothetical protein
METIRTAIAAAATLLNRILRVGLRTAEEDRILRGQETQEALDNLRLRMAKDRVLLGDPLEEAHKKADRLVKEAKAAARQTSSNQASRPPKVKEAKKVKAEATEEEKEDPGTTPRQSS